jgi:hypothetical protein
MERAMKDKIVAMFPIDVKELAEWQLALAVVNGQCPNFCVREATDNVWSQRFGFQWDGRFPLKMKRRWHGDS